ncbi:hypothetical protein PAHAL_3G079500 [Panicum hallii]|uniref:Uncharacterized protein n=1 Tax=Panicum hallii TaxID=206008 RepID=A0A2S3H723_9POAL|nr:uncharacterized protein LOC112887617 [Panicum hallii]PAN16713.1 hypothetical protein PAHAL_3G079500 [Panicum hallii]
MGNMLPCLVQGSSSIVPPMNTTKHWSRSMKLLVRTLRRSTERPHGSSSSVKAAASSRETPAADQQAARRTRRGPRGGQNRRAPVRVKVVLTRAAAARLLSLTAHGDRTAAQVVGELKRMQAAAGSSSRASTAHQVINELKRTEELLVGRANTSPSSASTTTWRPVLESIPEWP